MAFFYNPLVRIWQPFFVSSQPTLDWFLCSPKQYFEKAVLFCFGFHESNYLFFKSCIRGTLNLSTNADISTNIKFFGEKRKRKNSIRNDSLFLRLYELVHKCTSPPVEHLPLHGLSMGAI